MKRKDVEFSGVVQLFLGRNEICNKTRQTYSSLLYRFGEALPEATSMLDIEKKTVKAFLSSLPISLESRRKYLQILRSLWSWAASEGYAIADPTKDIRLARDAQKITDYNAPRHIPADHLSQILETLRQQQDLRTYSFVCFLLDSGARLNEALQLNLESWNKGEFRVLGKGRKLPKIYWGDRAISAIQEYLESDPGKGGRKNGLSPEPSPPLWTSQDRGSPWIRRVSGRVIQSDWAKACYSVGERYTIHQLRHTMGVDCIKFMSLEETQYLLGHESIRTTQRYRKIEESHAKSVACRRLAQVSEGSREKPLLPR